MIIKRIKLLNWKNFPSCDVQLSERCFVVGANAAGKSNFIDALRFLRDISKQSGSLQGAVEERGGMKKIRCLAARRITDISIEVELGEPEAKEPTWKYSLVFNGTGGGIVKNQVKIKSEKAWYGPEKRPVLDRSDKSDGEDEETLKYTHLEQPSTGKELRELRSFFQNIEYLNIVPQLVRESASAVYSASKEDYYGRNFLERLTKSTNETTRKSYFNKISKFLTLAVPQLKELRLVKDGMGVSHLEFRYEHWRRSGAKQQEPQLSDGTLRLIGFLFALIDNKGVILLEEPELNLHSGIIKKIPEFIAGVLRQKKTSRQTILTTHSYDILSDQGISPEEVLLLRNTAEGTTVDRVSDIEEVRAVLDAGLSMADAVIPVTKPENIEQMSQLSFF